MPPATVLRDERGRGWPLLDSGRPLLPLVSTLVLATLSVSRILHLQRAAALAAIMAMICTAVIACVPYVAKHLRASRKVAANRKRLKKR